MRFFTLSCLVLFFACGLPPSDRQLRKPTFSGSTEVSKDNSGRLALFIPYVGQGDATLIQTPSKKLFLVDTGPPGAGQSYLYPLLKELGAQRLEALIISHYDLDHFGAIADLLSGPDQTNNTQDDIEVKVSLDRGGIPWDKSPAYDEYLNTLSEKNIPRQTLNPGETIELDPAVKIRCLAANGKVWFQDGDISEIDLTPETYAERENAASLALIIEFGDFRYLTSGDLTGGGSLNGYLTPDVESWLGESAGEVTSLHVNHHGSLTSSNPNFITMTSPEVVFIQAGKENPYGHPHEKVVKRWQNSGAQLFSTDSGQGFVLTTDGNFIHVSNFSVSNR